jgi:superfamily II DNA helicase RecQ
VHVHYSTAFFGNEAMGMVVSPLIGLMKQQVSAVLRNYG